MKKIALFALALTAAPAVWAAQPAGLPAEMYMTCADAGEMAKENSQDVAELVAMMGNASVETRGLKIDKSADVDGKVIANLNAFCAKDPQMLLVTAMDNAMRQLAGEKIAK
ncbi:MAG: YmgD family protein [Plesiomonas sp.]|uniref:YmgD family protein n=1 Tax=Plesiomonas sp. TaxID=2486279 RepID=UPI003F3957A3